MFYHHSKRYNLNFTSIFAILNMNLISLFRLRIVYSIQQTFKRHIRYCGLLKLSLLLDNGKLILKVILHAMKSCIQASSFLSFCIFCHFFRMSSPTTCVDLSQTKIRRAVKRFMQLNNAFRQVLLNTHEQVNKQIYLTYIPSFRIGY